METPTGEGQTIDTYALERQIIEALPGWIAREPGLKYRLQVALLDTADPPIRFDTFEEFIEWVDEDVSAEWVNGEVIIMSPASTRHQLIVGFLYATLKVFIDRYQLGMLLSAPYKMKLGRHGPEPDLIFVAQANQSRVKATYLDGPADLVVEVISPESIGRDRGEKFLAYEAAGIPEYWLLDPARQQAEFYQLGENGRYRLVPASADGRYHAHIIPGFWLQVEWLWATPLPSAVDVLRQLQIL